MAVFNEAIRRKGKAEEDIFFAKLDLELIAALHKKQNEEAQQYASSEISTTHTYQR